MNSRFRNLLGETTGPSLEPLLRQVSETGRVIDAPLIWEAVEGRRHFLYSGEIVRLAGEPCIVSSLVDVTGRTRLVAERELMLKLVGLLNAPGEARELVHTVTEFLRDWSGCDAVGVRLARGEDFPYFASLGFPAKFIEAENRICVRDGQGAICRDGQGRAVLECMCGAVIRGQVDRSLACFTPMGTFWTNSTTELTAPEPWPHALHTRNRCLWEGSTNPWHWSATSSDERSGVQFDDRRRGDSAGVDHAARRAANPFAWHYGQRRIQAGLDESELRLAAGRKRKASAGGRRRGPRFQQPLTVIKGYALLLLSELGRQPRVRCVAAIHAPERERRRSPPTVGFSRRQVLYPHLMDSKPAARCTADHLALVVEAVSLDVTLSDSPAMVRADVRQLSRC